MVDRDKENKTFKELERMRPFSTIKVYTLIKAMKFMLYRLRRLEKRVRELEGD